MKIIILIFISFLFSVTGLEVATSMNNNPKPIDVKSDITLTLIKKKNTTFNDYNVSPKIRQSLQHWGYVLTEKDFVK